MHSLKKAGEHVDKSWQLALDSRKTPMSWRHQRLAADKYAATSSISLPVLLNPRRAETGKTVFFD